MIFFSSAPTLLHILSYSFIQGFIQQTDEKADISLPTFL